MLIQTLRHYFTMCFANKFARHLLLAGGTLSKATRTLATEMRAGGCEVTQLLEHRNSDWMQDLVKQIVLSQAFEDFINTNRLALDTHGEYVSLSIDATYKLPLKVDHSWKPISEPISLFSSLSTISDYD